MNFLWPVYTDGQRHFDVGGAGWAGDKHGGACILDPVNGIWQGRKDIGRVQHSDVNLREQRGMQWASITIRLQY
jgi:hypothetical protein